MNSLTAPQRRSNALLLASCPVTEPTGLNLGTPYLVRCSFLLLAHPGCSFTHPTFTPYWIVPRHLLFLCSPSSHCGPSLLGLVICYLFQSYLLGLVICCLFICYLSRLVICYPPLLCIVGESPGWVPGRWYHQLRRPVGADLGFSNPDGGLWWWVTAIEETCQLWVIASPSAARGQRRLGNGGDKGCSRL